MKSLHPRKSTLEVTIRDNYARVVRTEKHLRTATGWQLVAASNFQWNFSNQLLKRATSKSTSFDLAAGAIFSVAYNGERITSVTDETGGTSSYT